MTNVDVESSDIEKEINVLFFSLGLRDLDFFFLYPLPDVTHVDLVPGFEGGAPVIRTCNYK